jgi:hypothetical protein
MMECSVIAVKRLNTSSFNLDGQAGGQVPALIMILLTAKHPILLEFHPLIKRLSSEGYWHLLFHLFVEHIQFRESGLAILC